MSEYAQQITGYSEDPADIVGYTSKQEDQAMGENSGCFSETFQTSGAFAVGGRFALPAQPALAHPCARAPQVQGAFFGGGVSVRPYAIVSQ